MKELYYVNKDAVRTLIDRFILLNHWNTPSNYAIRGCLKKFKDNIDLMPTITKSELFNTAELVWWEEWSPSTPECPRECIGGGWKCGNCQEDLGDYLTRVGGERCYFDKFEEKPQLAFCPSCGRRFNK